MNNKKNIPYLTGFGSYFESEALENTLPKGQNSPQKVPYGLYAEQLSGTAFTAPRHRNQRSWLYRILPSVKHQEFYPYQHEHIHTENSLVNVFPPNQMRWNPITYPKKPTHFIDSLIKFAGNGQLTQQIGANIYLYATTESMHNCYFYNADGEMLIVLQEGALLFHTEFGLLSADPGEIVVIPRGVKFQVELLEKKSRGYVLENFGSTLTLPERGPIGANGLANERDFLIPQAKYETRQGKFQLITKFRDGLWHAEIDHSPLDVVAWHGNYTPYKYDLRLFNTMNSVSFDHADPSIFTVLTSQSDTPGIANVDFVIFPERWVVAEHSFRPPYYHRNIMSEFMGLIYGVYDAKEEGFLPGGCSLHNGMSAHGPDSSAYEKAIKSELKPQYYKGTLSFMFESRYNWSPSTFALNTAERQKDYLAYWQGLQSHFQK